MAFDAWLSSDSERGSTCDKCGKLVSADRPLVSLEYRSKRRDDRQYMQIHLDCLQRIVDTVSQAASTEEPVKSL